MSYSNINELKTIRGNDNRLLVGVTGGIASGKTTVTNMLEKLGAQVIDFDIIARQVVERGQPALNEISDYFGKQVLGKDGYLDRKKLSKIVFNDPEKRKKLESFIHPRINMKFKKQVNEIAAKKLDAIICVVIPLLIEQNLQDIFHKLIVVYIPKQEQVKRLAARDGITRDEAANMLLAQLPIDEKVKYSDFVIYNDKSIEETEKQVHKLWKTLRKLQKERGKSNF